MDAVLLRRKMMDLWKETFHDTDDYIRLVFDAYFTSDNVYCRCDGETLVSSMLCVPYGFVLKSPRGFDCDIRGMYLCGLATRPEYRGKGIMADLMREAERDIRKRGYDLSFLIPADSHLRRYYARMGYFNASFRERENIRFSDKRAFLRCCLIKDLYDSDPAFVESLAGWCVDRELERKESTMLHSVSDMLAVISENENAFFLTDPTFDLKYPILAKVVAVVFPDTYPGESGGLVTIQELYKGSCLSGYDEGAVRMDDDINVSIGSLYPDSDLIVMKSCLSSQRCDVFANCEPYAMAKILNKGTGLSETDVPVFNISLMLD